MQIKNNLKINFYDKFQIQLRQVSPGEESLRLTTICWQLREVGQFSW